MQTSADVVATLRSAIESNQALLVDELEQKQESTERRVDELLNELQQEIDELQRRSDELQNLEHTEDHLHLIQVKKTPKCPLMFSSTLDCFYQRYFTMNCSLNTNTIPDKTFFVQTMCDTVNLLYGRGSSL